MESLSRVAVTSSGKGSSPARRSSSPFSLSLCRLDGLDLAPSAGGCFTLMNTEQREQIKAADLRIPSTTDYSELRQNSRFQIILGIFGKAVLDLRSLSEFQTMKRHCRAYGSGFIE